MSTAENPERSQSSTDQSSTTERTQLALTYNEEDGTATISSAPPGELTAPPTEWVTVDESLLVDTRENR
jgi:hypothetical protein